MGSDGGSIPFSNYPFKVVDFLSRGDKPSFENRYIDNQNIQGIIGLGASSDFVQWMSENCIQGGNVGFGVNLIANSFISFGGVDPGVNNIKTRSGAISLNPQNTYDAMLTPNIPGGFGINQPIKNVSAVSFDPLSSINFVPGNIMDLPGELTDSSSLTIVISGVSFSIQWADLKGNAVISDDSRIILGSSFFKNTYTILSPDSETLLLPLKNTPETQNVVPFSQTIYGSSQKTNTEIIGSPASGAPLPSTSSSSSSTPTPTASSTVSRSSLNIGAIVGGVVGGIVLLVLVALGVCCFFRRRKLMSPRSRGIEKEYEADFDAEIGHHEVGFFPQFKESGYASLPTPPPPPPSGPQIPPLNIGDSSIQMYDSHGGEYTPTIESYRDEIPSRSLNSTPKPVNTDGAGLLFPPRQRSERTVSTATSVSLEPPSPISRNVTAISRHNYPSIRQVRARSSRSVVLEEDDDDAVSIVSVPAYNSVHTSTEASSSAPRLPFNRGGPGGDDIGTAF
ncbi:hypothetical protein AA313_de0210343 [Arthrobotrys entomopaga]|nr:hypothetical protein AA313_de0210343 [Arthrobotrys entomopaga]